MNIRFLLNEIKFEQIEQRLNSKKLRDLIWSYYENSSFANKTSFKHQVHLFSSKKETANSVQSFIYSDECFNFLIDIFKNEGDIEEKNRPICLNWYISKELIPRLKQKETATISNLLGMNSYIGNYYINKVEKFFQYQRFIDPPEKRDLMNVEDWHELNSILYPARQKYEKWIEQNKYKILKQKAEYRKIHEDDEFKIYLPDNKEAACLLGMGTKWCTAAMTSQNYYKDYHKEGDPLFILISKSDPNIKYQFHFGTRQFMDKNDEGMDLDLYTKLVERYSQIFSKYANSALLSCLTDTYDLYGLKRFEHRFENYRHKGAPKSLNRKNGKWFWYEHIGDNVNIYIPDWIYNLFGPINQKMIENRRKEYIRWIDNIRVSAYDLGDYDPEFD